MFRQIKEMKAMLEGPDGAVAQAPLIGAQAQQVVRQARLARADGAGADGAFEPIAGVSLEAYAAISRCAAAFGHDPAKMAEVAAARGISALAWQTAVAGWNARLRTDSMVARRFNLRYRES